MQTDQKKRLLYLLAQYADNQLTEAEALEMHRMLQDPDARELMEGMAEAESITDQSDIHFPEADWKRIWAGIQEAKEPVAKVIPIRRRKSWLSAAAVLLLIAAGTAYFIGQKTNEKLAIAASSYKGDVAAPAINKATLTLANGKQIILENIGKGSLAAQGVMNASKTAESALAYNNESTVIEYHTLTNPKGSKPIELTLPDGSIAWLNAASSITFPTGFKGTERMITMTGEAYFEVLHNEKQPFKVKAGTQTIEDIGTSFNVNAYSDEPAVKTTLIEGVIKINNAILKPGQQYMNGNIERANIEQTLAWKNGFFGFDNADIHAVMRQLARWYDVEVRYEGTPNNKPYQGDIGRGLTLAQVLKVLEQAHVHFRIEEDKRIVILP